MTNISLITTPDLTQDTMGKVAQCRTNIIFIYRELTADDRFETEPGASFPVNVMNQGSSSKTPVTKPDGTKMFRSVFLNDARRCCFFTNIIVKYYYDHIHNLVVLWKSCSMAN